VKITRLISLGPGASIDDLFRIGIHRQIQIPISLEFMKRLGFLLWPIHVWHGAVALVEEDIRSSTHLIR
jgi:hypothetical protein